VSTPAAAPPVVELDHIGVRYPGTPPVDALRDVDLEVGSGELVAVVGPSGSGKSTLLHVMGTLERPTGGLLRIAGHAVAGLSDARLSGLRARHIGFVFQHFHLLEGTSALDNVAGGLLYRGLPSRQRRRLAAEALERVGLAHRLHHRPGQLSGGERQRVAIARAVAGRPSVVLADEPTGNLDSRSGRDVVALLLELNRQGTTIVVITHDHDVAAAFPRQVALRDGRVMDDETEVRP
jgi:putative ABC transport system ATP-binding protein